MNKEQRQWAPVLIIVTASVAVVLVLVAAALSTRAAQPPQQDFPPPLSTGLSQPIPTGPLLPDPVQTAAAEQAELTSISLSATPTFTPIPPTPTAMPAGWEPLERLASASYLEPDDKQEQRLTELYNLLYRLPGAVIAQGESVVPACYNGPRGYRIEEVLLPGYVSFYLGGGSNPTVDRYWRVTVYGGPFLKGAQPTGIQADTHLEGYRLQTNGDTEVSLIYFYTDHIYEGSTIGLTYKISDNDGRRLDVPMKVHFDEGRPEQKRLVTVLNTPTPYIDLDPAVARRIYENDLLWNSEGKVIAQSEHTYSSCMPDHPAYKLEEISLSEPTSFEANGTQVAVDKVWRLTVYGHYRSYSGGYTQVGPWSVRIGDTTLNTFERVVGLVAVIFDPTILREGASITACAQHFPPRESGSDSCEELPEKLHFIGNRQARPTIVGQATSNPTEAACLKEASLYNDLYSRKGKVVAKGSNTLPTCFHNLIGYEIEEVRLPTWTEFEIEGKQVKVDRYWRVTAHGAKFPDYQNGAVIWLDGTPLTVKKSSGKTTEVTAITFDGSLISEGAAIEFSYDPSSLHDMLPEKLHLSDTRP